jgi:GNAT superfamily N-acetyltransferase
VRELTSLDIQQIVLLIAESEAEGFHFLTRLRRDDSVDTAYLESDHSIVLGIFDGERLVATGGLTPDPYLDDPTIGRVRHVYVASEYRRRGLGRELIAALEHRARPRYGLLRLRTDTARAAAFYEAIGYQPITADSATHARALMEGNRAAPT